MRTPEAPEPRAQARENAEPSERIRPVPLLAALVTLAMVVFGAGYLMLSDPFGRADLGDRRTLADLSSAKPNAAGGGAAAQEDGKTLFAAHCAACHQPTGKGLPGVFPPLDGSQWVTGEARTLVAILLHGISGEIEVGGQSYKGLMPSFKQLSDAQIAALASHIRSGWSNTAGPVTVEQVDAARKAIPRDTPFAGGGELKALAASK